MTLQNNDRRLFFQDQEGVVKQAIYSDAMKHWNAAFSNVVASDARNHTPFAVHSVLPAGDQLGSALTRDNKSEMVISSYSKKSLSQTNPYSCRFICSTSRRITLLL